MGMWYTGLSLIPVIVMVLAASSLILPYVLPRELQRQRTAKRRLKWLFASFGWEAQEHQVRDCGWEPCGVHPEVCLRQSTHLAISTTCGFPNSRAFGGLGQAVLQATDQRAWDAFVKRYRAEMKRPEVARLIALLAALFCARPISPWVVIVRMSCAAIARC